MPAVLDLIEIGFHAELDPQGWKMLRQMRQIARSNTLSRAAYSRGLDAVGFVWVESDVIIGNLSLRHAQPRSHRGRMIGNVVVHPDWRGHGIGRTLMERAIQVAQEQGARWIGLEVRADNVVACRLYERLGFRSVGKTEHLLKPDGINWPRHPQPGLAWRRSKPQDDTHWKRLAAAMHSYDQKLVLETAAQRFQFGGLEHNFGLLLSRQAEQALLHEDNEGTVTMAIHIKTDRRFRFHVWKMLASPELNAPNAQEIINQCLDRMKRFPPWPAIAIVPEQSLLVPRLTTIGFERHRTLQQMILEF
jgi:ribosomal protein S18 acetylase RimI-like enzyme